MQHINQKRRIYQTMQNNKIKKLVLSALFAAIICVATAVFAFPLPGNGYANLGDCFVIICGALVGSWWGAAAAAVGSALSDIVLSYALYAPATFIIKGLMALAVYFIVKKSGSVLRVIIGAVCAEVIMVLGYFIFECFILGVGGALADIPGNAVQGVVGLVTGSVILSIFVKNKKLSAFFK